MTKHECRCSTLLQRRDEQSTARFGGTAIIFHYAYKYVRSTEKKALVQRNQSSTGRRKQNDTAMISLPVMGRELLSAARSPLQYRLRIVVGAAAVFFVAAMGDGGSGLPIGLQLFAVLHCTSVVMCLLVAPGLTADAI